MSDQISENLFFYLDFAQPRVTVFSLRFIPGLALYTRIKRLRRHQGKD
jgi:hypothetical protein